MSTFTEAVDRWLARCVGDPVKAVSVGSTTGRDRVKGLSKFSHPAAGPVHQRLPRPSFTQHALCVVVHVTLCTLKFPFTRMPGESYRRRV